MRASAISLAVVAIAITVAWTSLNASADISGPDPSGYTWTDSTAPAPFVTPNWIDITTTGTAITGWDGGDDDGVWAQPLPFGFNFFGDTYDAVQISTNGFISFAVPGPNPWMGWDCNRGYNWDDITNLGFPIPHGDADCYDDGWGLNPLIAAFFDDLDPGKCGNVYYSTTGSAPNRMFVVQWDDVCHHNCDACAAGEGVTFEVILYEGSNDIKIQYADTFFSQTMPLENYGASATSGLSFDATTGLPFSHAQQALASHFAVLYSPASAPTSTPTESPTEAPTASPTATATPTASPTATPSATPAGQTVLWGDANCSDAPPDPVDSLITLRHDAGLTANTGDCPALGTTVDVAFASLHVWGDIDCSGGVDPVDSLKLLRSDVGLDVTQETDCPEIGQQVQITPQ